jgi:predicted acetyltransferase
MTPAPDGIELRPATADEMVPLITTTHRAFGDDVRPDRLERDIASVAPERTLAAFDGADIVGVAAIYTFDMTVPGGPIPVAGVTWVGVLGTHRRRGILSSMMRRQLTELHEQEREPVAALWASEPTIYRRYGYGLASRRIGMTIETKLPYVAGAPEPQPLRLLPAEGFREAVAAVYERARPTRPGMLSRFPQRWDGLFDDTEASREGASSLTCALLGSGDGYVLYRTKGSWDDWLPNGTVIVRELVALNPSAYSSLWRYLLDIDLMTKVEAWNRPLDEPLLHLVADPRRLHQTLGDALWVRLVDVDRALAARTYPVADSLVFEVVDSVCPWNAGRFALDVEAAHVPAAVRRTDSSADLTLSAVELGSVYLGGTRLRDLAAAGFVDEHNPGAVARADRLFAGDVEPWCPEIF